VLKVFPSAVAVCIVLVVSIIQSRARVEPLLRIRGMTVADIPLGMRLKEQAGWNQVEADWQRLLDLQPHGCFVAELDGIPAGTVTTCRFGLVAWVAMMLVDKSFRSHGIGRALMSRALEDLDSAGIRTIRLDATPLGRPLYESLDFVAEATFAKYIGVLPTADGPPSPNEMRAHGVTEGLTELDLQVTGTDRGRLLRRLADEYPDSLQMAHEAGEITGFLLTRPGSKARRIGPCIAGQRAGPLLLDDARRTYAGEVVIIDIPIDNEPAGALAASWGLGVSGLLTRMGRGLRVREDLSRLWASSGPENG
jgi:GNAT superfamily N-acetyltransferase